MPASRQLTVTSVCLLFGLVLYVMSFGPVCWLNASGYVSLNTVNTTYYPLLQATRAAPHSRNWLVQYARIRGSQTAFIAEESGRVYFNWFDYTIFLCPSHP